MSRRSLRWRTALVSAVLCAGFFTGMSAALASPSATKSFESPGSATEIKNLVAASSKITTLTTQTSAQDASPQAAFTTYNVGNPLGCFTARQCVFGDTKSHKIVVLFGDSHAVMWLPAMDWIAKQDKLRLVVLWTGNCPAIWNVAGTNVINTACASFHTSAVRITNSLHPIAVIIGELTEITFHSNGTPLTEAEWQAGLTTTIKKFKAKVALIEDVVFFNTAVPLCLAANPTNVQACSVPAPNTLHPGQQAAEQAAAKATGATFVKTWPWLCTEICSPIVGNTMTYYDIDHITTDYSAYLSKVLRSALDKVL
jgi:hypothetical protein